MVHSTFQHPPPPPQSHSIHWEGGEGGGGQREGTQYTSIAIAPLSMKATVHKLGLKYKL
jgi:hypothetical protein